MNEKQKTNWHDTPKSTSVKIRVTGAGIATVNSSDILNSTEGKKQLEALAKLKLSDKVKPS